MSQGIVVNIIDNSLTVIKTGGEILSANQIRKDKALTVGENILQLIVSEGMTADLDARANNFLANCRKAKDEMNEARKPVTQILDAIKTEFTSVENLLDVSKAGTIPYMVQQHRNEYVKKVKAEEDRKRKEADDLANRNKEKVQLKAMLETQLSDYLNDCLLAKKTAINNAFNNITLETYEAKAKGLQTMPIVYPLGLLDEFKPNVRAVFLTAEDAREITEEVCGSYRASEGKSEFALKYTSELTQLKISLVDRLPSKKAELDQMAQASADRKAELEKEAADRKAVEERKMREGAEAAKASAAQSIELNKVAEETQVMFDKEAALVTDAPAPEARSGYNIEVKHAIGYTQLFQLWFEREGKNLPIDRIGNTKLDQMKAWCEKLAHKTNEKIESAYLEYTEVLKAVNKNKRE